MSGLPANASAPAARRILLVEDEPKLRQSMAEGLRMETWQVTEVGSGDEAFRVLSSETFDLLLLDRMLPDCDGLDVLRQVRKYGAKTPVLFVTARCSPVDKTAAIESGATDYMTKPFAFDDLLRRCRALLAPA